MKIVVYSEEEAIELSGEFMKIARAIKERAHFRESLEETILCDSLYGMRDSICVLRPEILEMANEKAKPELEPEIVMTEQQCWDEFMRLLDSQTKNSKGTNGFYGMNESLKALMSNMDKVGLFSSKTDGSYFTDWFYKVKGRLFSICEYRNGWTELRWG